MNTFSVGRLTGLRRVALAPASVTTDRRAAVVPRGERVASVPAHVRRSTTRARDGEVPTPTHSLITATWDDVDRALDRAGWLQVLWARDAPHDELAAVNFSMISKTVLQRGFSPGWFVHEPGYDKVGAPPLLALPALCADLVSALPDAATVGRAMAWKKGTNHGFPDARTDDESLALHIATGSRIRSEADAEAWTRRLCALFGLPDWRAFPAIQGTRTGFKAKPLPYYELTPDGPVRVGATTGLFPARRLINMVSATYNASPLRAAATAIKLALRRAGPVVSARDLSTFDHRTAEHQARKLKAFGAADLYADDISSFDLSVDVAHQRQLRDLLYSRALAPFGADPSLYEYTLTIGVLANALFAGDEAYYYARQGTTLSGVITTTPDGTIINAARVIQTVAAAAGWSVSESYARLRAGKWLVLIWGDDTLIAMPKGTRFDIEAYQQASAALGYTSRMEPAPVFLMSYLGRGRAHNLASRAFMQTVFREHGNDDEFVEVLGAFTRLSACKGDPALVPVVAALTEGVPFFRDRGLRTLVDMERWLTTRGPPPPEAPAADTLRRLLRDWARGADDYWTDPRVAAVIAAFGLEDAIAPDRAGDSGLRFAGSDEDLLRSWAALAARVVHSDPGASAMASETVESEVE